MGRNYINGVFQAEIDKKLTEGYVPYGFPLACGASVCQPMVRCAPEEKAEQAVIFDKEEVARLEALGEKELENQIAKIKAEREAVMQAVHLPPDVMNKIKDATIDFTNAMLALNDLPNRDKDKTIKDVLEFLESGLDTLYTLMERKKKE